MSPHNMSKTDAMCSLPPHRGCPWSCMAPWRPHGGDRKGGSTRSEEGQCLDTVKDIVVDPAMACTDMNSFIGKCGIMLFLVKVTKAACVPFRQGGFMSVYQSA